MDMDWDSLNFIYHNSDDSSDVLEKYVTHIANRTLLAYKHKIHTGGKAGESLWTHVMNLVTTIEKLRSLFELTHDEMCCLLLALTVHDLNKLDEYGKRPDGKNVRYSNAATVENITAELNKLEASNFFPEWEAHLYDIKYLVDGHQVASGQATQYDQNTLKQCLLDEDRLEGPLRELMRVADVADNSHSGTYADHGEAHIRQKLVDHLSIALYTGGYPRRYRFIGHRLAELRGLLTNVIHNEIVSYLRATYGEDACIDLLYHPSGVDYLLDQHLQLQWTPAILRQLAERIEQKFAELQLAQLASFIKARPFGISVDDAAMQSGATIEKIFAYITGIVTKKRYRQEWWELRNTAARSDLEAVLATATEATMLHERITLLLRVSDVLSREEEILKRGEFVAAYRNFLKDHRAEQLKATKQDAWTHVYRLFELPAENDALYQLIDPYRRGYFLARDLPAYQLEQMEQMALADLARLEEQAELARAHKGKKSPAKQSNSNGQPVQHVETADRSRVAALVDYLERTLEIWDSSAPSLTLQPVNFLDSLRRYTDEKRQDAQCCHCASPLKTGEWVSLQVPQNIGVQNFSNRLEGGSSREPLRNGCDICRTQFLLEKLAWRSHQDKQGSDLVTFYLHFFPYSFYTQPMLQAWWQSIDDFRRRDHVSLFLDTKTYFLGQADGSTQARPIEEQVRVLYRGLEGIGVPTFSDTFSTTPVLPLIAGGKNESLKFLLALEKAVLLARWFGSRVLLSRLPTPLLNLGDEKIDDQPVALCIENIPTAMSWLVSDNMLTVAQLETLHQRLHLLYRLARLLTFGDELAYREVIYDLVSAAAHDPLTMYYVADRLIEKQVARRKSAGPEYRAIEISGTVADLLKILLKEKTHA